jgi:hypothetical protein
VLIFSLIFLQSKMQARASRGKKWSSELNQQHSTDEYNRTRNNTHKYSAILIHTITEYGHWT